MKVVGIITEYNPFHNGHKLHLEATRETTSADGIVCVMSGNFTQRGIPAILDKWTRAKMAIENGVDLVLEIPTLFAVSSAEFFAKGAVDLLNSLGIVDSLCFGSESENIDLIYSIAKILTNEPMELKMIIKNEMDNGEPFTKARSTAILKYLLNSNSSLNKERILPLLNSSNNILGIEYCKNLIKTHSNIKPFTIKRIGSSYNDVIPTSEFASATSIRELINKNVSINELERYIPKASLHILTDILQEGYKLPSSEEMFYYIKYKLLTNPTLINKIPDVIEGLDNKIRKEIINATSLTDLILKIKSKRYTYTRISRILCQFFIGFDGFNIIDLRKCTPSYIRILALNSKGAQILKLIKKNSQLEIINKPPKYINDPMLKLDIQATNAYSILNPQIPINSDYIISPIVNFKK
ncbi:UPF0348 protein [Clostridium polyendosporum]|uniref:tRNA(Met) cytidine acetate ligase n=1 Tax=Clostridium polyendosporum TaxID=69208 RepID=A0A919VF76_9CLOT|nr:nucleotidyltransferase [Clostridium polyendosporum]GIM27842.1 UPF0348 protein [Clostridium polyendosporum]